MSIRIRELTINATIVGNDGNDSGFVPNKQDQLRRENGSPFIEDEQKARRER